MATNNPKDCYTDECLTSLATSLARVWKPHSRHKWCTPSSDEPSNGGGSPNSNNHTGLILVKVPKSASSTLAGLVLRIAERQQCSVRWQHARASDIWAESYFNATFSKRHTYWVAPIRHPHTRALSSVYYHSVSLQAKRRNNKNNSTSTPSDAYILRQLDRVMNNYITDYTYVSQNGIHDMNMLPPIRIVQDILEHYDFLLVVEDLEASLVVWSWLVDLPLADLVLMSSKTTGSWYATNQGRCVPLVPPVVTPAIQEYWRKRMTTTTTSSSASRHDDYTDRLLHATAHASLRRTIVHGMGQDLFDERLAEFRRLQRAVQGACGTTLDDSAPCSTQGVYQPNVAQRECYTRDFGCGHKCVNTAVDDYIIRHSIHSNGMN